MSEPVVQPSSQNLVVASPSKPALREIRVVESVIPLFDTGAFEHMQRIAQALSMASVIPDHLRVKPYFYPKKGDPSPAELAEYRNKFGDDEIRRAWTQADLRTQANCFLVVNQARNWNMDPVAVAMASYVVGGKIAYEGKLVAALINTRAGLERKLWYTFEGEGLERTITVHGTRSQEQEDRTVSVRVKDAKTDNQMWTKDPDQKLVYTGSVKWARRWAPEVVLGVMTEEDAEIIAEEKNVTPKTGSISVADVLPVSAVPPTATAAPASKPAESAPEAPPADPGGYALAAVHFKALRELAGAEPAVSWQAFEGLYGQGIDEMVSRDGETEDAFYDRLLADLNGLKDKAAPAAGSLFDVEEKGKSKK